MLELMLRAVVIGAFVTIAALLLERGLAHMRVGTRHAWTYALLATALAPFVPRLLPRTTELIPVMEMPAIVVHATSDAGSRVPIDLLVLFWISCSSLVLIAFAIAYVKLLRARRTWQPERIAQDEVFMSDRFGPAVFGFIAPRIVVPAWIRDTSAQEQELIVLHEREHIRAGDQLQLLLAIVATVLMPWNPFTWWQSRRLRFTIEADCDQRVLAAAPDRARYASLLVNVGTRQSGLLLTPALAEHGNGLEARVNMLAKKLVQNRWKAAGLIVVGLGVSFVACESRLPQDVTEQPQQGPSISEAKIRMQALETPRGQAGTIMKEEYPPLLREAGIGGTVGLRLHVKDGGVADQVEVVRSSGHDALDQAAVRVAKRFQWGNEGPGKPTSYWTSTSITFAPDTKDAKVAGQVREVVLNELKALPRKIDVNGEPHVTPYTRKPVLRNREEVGSMLVRSYPPLLRDAGIGGRLIAWLLIDESGKVIRTKVKETSGRVELDAAGLKVAEAMEFTPAEHDGNPVKVWIALPIVFKTK